MKTSALTVGLCTALLCWRPASAQVVAPSAETQTSDKDLINPDRPGIADGSSVIGRGRVQLEAGFQLEIRDIGGRTEHLQFVPTLVRAGLNDRWEVRFESNTVTHVDGPVGAGGTSELAPVSAGVKFHIQDSGGVHRPSLGAIARVFPTSGTGELHTTHATGDVRFAADWDPTSAWSLNPNVGVAFYEDDERRRFAAALYALTLNYFNRTKTLNPFIDIGIQAPEAPGGESSVIVDGGLACIIGRNVQLDVSAGRGAHGDTPPRPFFAVGVSVRFHATR